MSNAPRILAFCGSIRRESLNKKLLNAAVAAVREAGGEVTVLDLGEHELPLYHGDLEEARGLPENAAKLIGLIKQHQALLVASPEYNGMITPLLKNTLDWCTRGEEDPFECKVAAVLSASPGAFGGMRSQQMAQQLLLKLGCHVVPGTTTLPGAHKAFDESGALTDERAKKSVRSLAAALVDTARRFA